MSNAAVVFILVAIGIVTNGGSTFNRTVNIGVEQSTYTGFLRTRQDGKKVVYLKKNGQISKDFDIFSYCLFSSASVFYSNDGGSDSMRITLNGTTVGVFTTQPPSTDDLLRPSERWDIQHNSGPVGSGISVELWPGSHTVALTVIRMNCNGLEIGDITLHFACEDSSTSPASSTTTSSLSTSSTTSSTTPPQNSATFSYTPTSFFTTAGGIVLVLVIVIVAILILFVYLYA